MWFSICYCNTFQRKWLLKLNVNHDIKAAIEKHYHIMYSQYQCKHIMIHLEMMKYDQHFFSFRLWTQDEIILK